MLTIGEFSRLGHVSARMLRHYDRIDLLRPSHTGRENGYRYYDPAQLPILVEIETLKTFGFSLSEIRQILPLPGEERAQRIHARRLAAYAELNALRETLSRMEETIIKMEGTAMNMDKYHVILMNQPEQRVFGLRRTINISETDALFEEMKREAEKRGLKRAGATQTMYMGDQFDYDAMDVEAQMQVSGDADGVKIIPAGLYVATTHIGPYERVKYAYEAISAWMAENPAYRAIGPAIERYLKDEGMVSSPEELETGVLFPVAKGQ